MGDFFGHSILGLLFFAMGAWHLKYVLYYYALSPTKYKAKIWYPFPGRVRCLELYVLGGGFMFVIFYELSQSTTWGPFDERGFIPFEHLFAWEHSSMLVLFILFDLALLLNDKGYLPLPPAGGHIMAGIAFGAEFVVYALDAAKKTNLEGQLHRLLSLIAFFCMATSFLQSWQPGSFLIDLVGSMALVLHGTWFIQIAFSLYVDMAVPWGCDRMPDTYITEGSVDCESPMSTMRAKALMNLAFNWHMTIILLATLALHAATTSKFGHLKKGYEIVGQATRQEACIDDRMVVNEVQEQERS